jgi:tetratricopeptide (TPR) repeat protein
MRAMLRQIPGLSSWLDRLVDDGRPLLRRLTDPPEWGQDPITEADARLQVAAHPTLLRRYGAARVLDHYDHRVWPALSMSAPSASVADSKLQAALNAIDTATKYGPLDKAVAWGDRALEAVRDSGIGAPPEEAVRRRKEARRDLASRLREVATLSGRAGRNQEALRAWQLVSRLGELAPVDREVYGRLLWDAGSRDHALRVGVRGAAAGSPPPVDEQWLHGQLAITEDTAPELIPERLRLNHALIMSARDQIEALRNLGVGYLKLDRPERSLPYLERAMELKQANSADAFNLGQAHFRLGRFTESSDMFARAAAQGFSKVRIAAWQALALVKSGQYEKAAVHFQTSEAELGPENLTSEFFVYWGRASFVSRAFDDAEHRFRRALELRQDDWRAVVGLAVCLERSGRGGDARALLRARLEAVSQAAAPAAAAYLFGRLLQADGELAEATLYYRLAVHAQAEDPQYLLALALALDDLHDPGALPALERAAATPAAGAEVFRRLALKYLESGNRTMARVWLARLADGDASSPVMRAFLERDLVSRAVEACNDGRYAEATRLIAGITGPLRTDPEVRRLRALTLACSVWERLRVDAGASADLETIRGEVAAARELASLEETEFIGAFLDLATGDPAAARDRFNVLIASHPHQREYAVFSMLSECLAQTTPEVAGSMAARIDGVSEVAPLIAIFEAYLAARAGDYPAATGHFQRWAADTGALQQLALPSSLVNEFGAACLQAGAQRPSQVSKWLAQLSDQHGRYWDLASVLIKHHDLASRGPADATALKLEQCEEGYRALLSDSSPAEARRVAVHYAEWLQFRVQCHLRRQEVREVLVVVGELERLPVPAPPAILRLRAHLEERLRRPSHEGAYAVVWADPRPARKTWEALLQAEPSNLEALHHLACLCWTGAYDEVGAGRYEQSIPLWRDGLAYYQRLYRTDEFWAGLRAKGASLVHPGRPFDEHAFDEWRRDALVAAARTLIDLILHLLQFQDGRVKQAVEVMQVIRQSGLDAGAIDQLANELATRRLDPDPTQLPDFAASIARAKQIIDVDGDNIRARSFLLRAVVHRVHQQHAEGERQFPKLLRELDACGPHATWLERHALRGADRRSDLVQDLVGYYDEVADIQHAYGYAAVPEVNDLQERVGAARDFSTRRAAIQELEQKLLHARGCFRASDAAAAKSLELEPANFKATQHRDSHSQNYTVIESILTQIRGS